MILDVDRLINFMDKFLGGKSSLEEQDADTTTSTDSGAGKTASPTIKKWESGRKYGKTYMNDPKYKWNSDRTLGKTYMMDPKFKWETGLTRGHANPVP